tara:strand:+ start:89 stop:1027 length:939 start_codon:yes stop_codon:yes gene_type:complete
MRIKTETLNMKAGGSAKQKNPKRKQNRAKSASLKDKLKEILKPKPTGGPQAVKDFFKKKNKDKIKDKVKQKLKEKKKSKPTKTGLLSKAGIAPVSAPGGIPKVQSQKTAQKDAPKKPKTGRPPEKRPPMREPRPPRPIPMPIPKRPEGGPRPVPMPTPKRPEGGPRPVPMPMPKRPKYGPIPIPRRQGPEQKLEEFKRFMDPRALKDGGELKKMFGPAASGMSKAKLKRLFDMAKKQKPTGRVNMDDIKRVAKMLGQNKKPVLDSKGKPVQNLFQKSKKRDLKSIVKAGPKAMRKPMPKLLGKAARKMRKMM